MSAAHGIFLFFFSNDIAELKNISVRVKSPFNLMSIFCPIPGSDFFYLFNFSRLKIRQWQNTRVGDFSAFNVETLQNVRLT